MLVTEIRTENYIYYEIGSDLYLVDNTNLILVDKVDSNIISNKNIYIGLYNYDIPVLGNYLEMELKNSLDFSIIELDNHIYQIPSYIYDSLPDINIVLDNKVLLSNNHIINFNDNMCCISIKNYYIKKDGTIQEVKGVVFE